MFLRAFDYVSPEGRRREQEQEREGVRETEEKCEKGKRDRRIHFLFHLILLKSAEMEIFFFQSPVLPF